MSQVPRSTAASAAQTAIRHAAHASSLDIPSGYVGPYWLPGTGRLVWWTGRVAIGLRHENPPRADAVGASQAWVQRLLADGRRLAWLN